MKLITRCTISLLICFSATTYATAYATASANTCFDNGIQGGVDIWPWSVARPFPWGNIEGYWKLGDDQTTYLSAQVLSSTNKRKILSLNIHKDGFCSKPYAKGAGYIDATEKNVVRALLSDGTYKYQLKLAMFDGRDIIGFRECGQNIVGASLQVIARSKNSKITNPQPLDPAVTETQNMLLKKVTFDVIAACEKIN